MVVERGGECREREPAVGDEHQGDRGVDRGLGQPLGDQGDGASVDRVPAEAMSVEAATGDRHEQASRE